VNEYRRGIGIGVYGSCILLLILIMALTPEAVAADTMFRNDPQHTGVFENGGTIPTNTELWRFETRDLGSPVVTSGVVYLGGNPVYLGSGSEYNLYAIDAVTGTELWKFSTGGMVESTPAVASGIVYIGSGDSNLYAIDAVTGKEKWKFATDGWIFSSPAVASGVVYIGSFDKNLNNCKTSLYAIDAVAGTELWRFTTEGDLKGNVVSSPAVANGVVYVGSFDKNLYAIDAVTGREKWRFATGDLVSSSPAVANGVVYVGSDDKNLYAIDTVTGKEKWRFATGDLVSSSPAVANGVVYVGSWDDNLYAIDAVTGKEKWRFQTGDFVESSPAVASDVVYVGSRDKNLYAIDAVTGRERWRFSAGSWVISSPAVESGVVYIVSWDGILYAVGRASSTPTLTLLATPKTPPIFPSSNNNFTLPIIVVLILLFLIGGGYAISRMKKKPSAGQLPDSETRTTDGYLPPTTGSSSGGWNSTAIADLQNRVASVEQRASVLSRFKGPVQALIAKAREQFRSGAYDSVQSTLNTAENAIPSLAQCEERLKKWKKDGYITTPLESLKTDDIPTIINAFQDFEHNIAKIEKLGRRIQDLKESFSQGYADPSISKRIAIIASQLKDPHSIAGIEGEIEALEQILRDRQEHSSALTDLKERANTSVIAARKFGRVPTAIQERLASERISDVENAIADLDVFTASAQPALTITLDRTSLDADRWHKVGVQITNSGDAHAFDVSFSFSSEF
jgi:outer membrane protein assembly factor BamB